MGQNITGRTDETKSSLVIKIIMLFITFYMEIISIVPQKIHSDLNVGAQQEKP
jgi:hypothetical protein